MSAPNIPTCPACSTAAPKNACFCPRCGEPLAAAVEETVELPGIRPNGTWFAPRLHEARRRPFGLEPLALLAGLEAAGLIGTIVLFAVGVWPAGIAVLALTAVLLGVILAGARRQPEMPLARRTLILADRVQSLARLGLVAVATGLRAGVRIARVGQRRQRLRHELRRQLQPLGEAVHRGDAPRARALKAQARRLEQALAATEREREAVLGRVRQELAAERAAIDATQPHPRPTGDRESQSRPRVRT